MKTETTFGQRFFEILSVLGILSMCLLVALYWDRLPERMPTHYNAAGEIDGWGGRGSVLWGPIFSACLWGLLTLVQAFPQSWNTGVRVTEENREAVYHLLKSMLIALKFSVVLLCAALTITEVLQLSLGIWFGVVLTAVPAAPIVYYLIRLLRLHKKTK